MPSVKGECVCMCVCVCACACECACVCVCVCVCGCMSVCVLGEDRGTHPASLVSSLPDSTSRPIASAILTSMRPLR